MGHDGNGIHWIRAADAPRKSPGHHTSQGIVAWMRCDALGGTGDKWVQQDASKACPPFWIRVVTLDRSLELRAGVG